MLYIVQHKFIVLEIFHAFNFRGTRVPTKIFNLEHFPIYSSGKVWQVCIKFGDFDESSVIHQTKTIQSSIYLPNFFCQMLEKSKFA